jgi:hypothetical protein
MIDPRKDKVHRIYLVVSNHTLKALKAGSCRELDFFNELKHIIQTDFAESRKLISTNSKKEQNLIRKYSDAVSAGFLQWNIQHENDPGKTFTDEEVDFLATEVSEFLKNGLPDLPASASNDPPNWMTELLTVFAFCTGIDAFDEDGGEFSDPTSWQRACERANEVFSLYFDTRNQDHISEIFQLTYPASATVHTNAGTEVRVRKRGKYVRVALDNPDDNKKDKSSGENEDASVE